MPGWHDLLFNILTRAVSLVSNLYYFNILTNVGA